MKTYYAILGVEPHASQQDIEVAYLEQRSRYEPERVAAIDDQMRQIAEERTAEIERVYATLADKQRRAQYDQMIGLDAAHPQPTEPSPSATTRHQQQRRLRRRDYGFIIGSMAVGLALIAIIWTITGQRATNTPVLGKVDRPAPEITLAGLDGSQVRLSDYRGKTVLVNFWGTWCEPCKQETPALQAAYEQLRTQDFVIIGVNLTDDEVAQGHTLDEVRAFAEQYGVTYPIALDSDGTVANAYRIFPIPTSYFIDPAGHIRYVRVGELTTQEVMALFRELNQAAITRGGRAS